MRIKGPGRHTQQGKCLLDQVRSSMFTAKKMFINIARNKARSLILAAFSFLAVLFAGICARRRYWCCLRRSKNMAGLRM
ncbi:hypothetical protein C824_003831 [Schaedlerella arabinosiphila]|nr:hypothetical protein C824_003831 [Schaedlerella arabinosiphila]